MPTRRKTLHISVFLHLSNQNNAGVKLFSCQISKYYDVTTKPQQLKTKLQQLGTQLQQLDPNIQGISQLHKVERKQQPNRTEQESEFTSDQSLEVSVLLLNIRSQPLQFSIFSLTFRGIYQLHKVDRKQKANTTQLESEFTTDQSLKVRVLLLNISSQLLNCSSLTLTFRGYFSYIRQSESNRQTEHNKSQNLKLTSP